MVVERIVLPYWTWLITGTGPTWNEWGAAPRALVIVAIVALCALALGYLIAAVRHGPIKGGDITYRVVRGGGLKELLRISPRRVLALAWLAVQESIRRQVWVVLVVFAAILAMASWFFGTESTEPARVLLAFVFTTVSFLVILIALFLSTFSLPTDIKNKTIYTVVTKPVYASEIVLGRILGFTTVGTVLLMVMAVLGYIFVWSQVGHQHSVERLDKVADSETGEIIGGRGFTTKDSLHQHDLEVDENGVVKMEARHGHRHSIESSGSAEDPTYEIGLPQEMFVARVPKYGTLQWRNRTGQKADRGVNVGNEWTYRSFIAGGTDAAAIWTFNGISPDSFPKDEFKDGLPLEVVIRVFRTWKGQIVDEETNRPKGISGVIFLKNPKADQTGKQLTSGYIPFEAKDAYIDRITIPWEMEDTEGNTIDVMKDLVEDGEVEVWLRCMERQQYFGVARADVYLHARDGSFALNFVKGYASIWAVMVWVIGCGVMISTLVSGPVAMLFTLGVGVIGLCHDKIYSLAIGDTPGGGPVESLVRIIPQMNMVSPLTEGVGKQIVETLDFGFLKIMEAWLLLVPNLNHLNSSSWVANGFDIPGDLLAQQLTKALFFVAGMFVVGYFFFRTREVAK